MQSNGTTETVRQYYALAGATAGMREGSSFSWFLTDHLGSVVGVTDSNATLVSQTRYTPFGEIRTDVGTVTETDYGYTFQRDVDGMGLMDYKARYYSPLLGRFIQPDSLIPGAGNPQNFDRYSYVRNNPINFNDPSGHMFIDDDKIACVTKKCLDSTVVYEQNGDKTGPILPPQIVVPTFPTPHSLPPILPPLPTPTKVPPIYQPNPTPAPPIIGESPERPSWKFPYKFTIDKENIDWFDLTIDGLGIVGDVSLVAFPEGPGEIVDLVASVAELTGAIKTTEEILQNDYSGVNTFSVGLFFDLVKENPILVAKFGRLAPGLGILGNGYGIVDNLQIRINRIPTE